MTSPAASDPSGGSGSVADLPWVHITPHGTEIGGEVPKGQASNAVAAFIAAVKLGWSVRAVLWVLVLRDFKSRYRAQALGLFWSFAQPLIMMVTFTIAFKYVLRVDIQNFQIFYLIGGVFWQFFTNSLLAATGTMLENGGLVKRSTFPRFLYPIAAVLSHLILLGMEMVLVFAFFFVFPEAYVFNATLVVLPLLVLIVAVMTTGLGFITCGLNARFRDIQYLVTSFITVAFWATPIIYRSSMVPPWLAPVMALNPIAVVIEAARSVMMEGEWPNFKGLGIAGLGAIAVFFVGCAVFRRENLTVADYV